MNDVIASSPFFNLKPHRLSDQLLNEMLAQLLAKNQQVISDHTQNNTFTVSPSLVLYAITTNSINAETLPKRELFKCISILSRYIRTNRRDHVLGH